MFSDNSLVPREAVRLMALGSLMEAPRSYGDLARDIRFLTARIVGPSLDLLGSSLELLRIEGLAEVEEGTCHLPEDERRLRVTGAGKTTFETLMAAAVRPPLNDIDRLVLILKLRFLPLLSIDQQLDQLELLEETYISEEARFRDLLKDAKHASLAEWVSIDADQAAARLKWIQARIGSLDSGVADHVSDIRAAGISN